MKQFSLLLIAIVFLLTSLEAWADVCDTCRAGYGQRCAKWTAVTNQARQGLPPFAMSGTVVTTIEEKGTLLYFFPPRKDIPGRFCTGTYRKCSKYPQKFSDQLYVKTPCDSPKPGPWVTWVVGEQMGQGQACLCPGRRMTDIPG